MTRPENCILSPDTPWSGFNFRTGGTPKWPRPQDSYGGAREGAGDGWGLIDNNCPWVSAMTDAPRPLNRPVIEGPAYAQPVLGNPASTLMETGVGNCYPGLEFDLRQLDVRFFPGPTFEFLGAEPAGLDGAQGVLLVNADVESVPILAGTDPWILALKAQLNGLEGAALGSAAWYLHWVEQHDRRIDLYDFAICQNLMVLTPYEGETCWWIIRVIEPDAPLTIALTQPDGAGAPIGNPVVLRGQRRRFLADEGMIVDVYRPGELTASMCSPWTHDFRDCACQYRASNHPDVVLGPVAGGALEDGTAAADAAQAVTFMHWLRRRGPARDVSAVATFQQARPDDCDPYEINLRWEDLDFVLHGIEIDGTPERLPMAGLHRSYDSTEAAMQDMAQGLAPLEFTLSMVYLYACFSLRAPDEVTAGERSVWPDLADDLCAVRGLILSVAFSEMTHLRWVNQMLWMLEAHGGPLPGGYAPVIWPLAPDAGDPVTAAAPDVQETRTRSLRPATPGTLADFIAVERPAARVDREFAGLVDHLRTDPDAFPPGLYELAVRIDSDGLQHYQKFRDVERILSRYGDNPSLFLRPVRLADDRDPAVQPALDLLAQIVDALRAGYLAESRGQMAEAEGAILQARGAMRDDLAVDAAGAYSVCHRFVNDPAGQLGSLGDGIDHGARRAWLAARSVETQVPCATCWARRLCDGGCPHEVVHAGKPACDYVRGWLHFALTAYARLMDARPGWFDGRG